MTTFTLILTIALIDFLSILTPGQDFAIVTRNALKYSKKIGYYTVLGIGFVTFCHCLLAMAGLSILISQYPDALALIKTLGAVYLIYLGHHFVKNAKNLTVEESKKSGNISKTEAFKMGAIANVLNIEPLLAFVSVFAILLPPETSLGIKLLICFLLPLNTMLWLGLIANIFTMKRIQNFLKKHLKTLEQTIGIVLIFFGSKNLISLKK